MKGETEGQVKNALVPIFNVFNLVPKYRDSYSLFSLSTATLEEKTEGAMTEVFIKERRQHDNTTKLSA